MMANKIVVLRVVDVAENYLCKLTASRTRSEEKFVALRTWNLMIVKLLNTGLNLRDKNRLETSISDSAEYYNVLVKMHPYTLYPYGKMRH